MCPYVSVLFIYLFIFSGQTIIGPMTSLDLFYWVHFGTQGSRALLSLLRHAEEHRMPARWRPRHCWEITSIEKHIKLLRARVSLATQQKMRELNFHSCTRIKEIIVESVNEPLNLLSLSRHWCSSLLLRVHNKIYHWSPDFIYFFLEPYSQIRFRI